eukprot:GCRY01003803.1.p1 GENE.GCRY01003803.1~~GCRY01003803.1.p1  ORF type:complete len:281 (+),score=39.75 GCRY01003803.1:167-1009(+)
MNQNEDEFILLEFKAGLMIQDHKKVKADPRRGLVRLVWNQSEEFLHFFWFERTLTSPEIDLLLFYGDVAFSCIRPADRIYSLDFTSEKFFFWLQEPSKEQDVTIEQKVNAIIAEPASYIQRKQFPSSEMEAISKLQATSSEPHSSALSPHLNPQLSQSFIREALQGAFSDVELQAVFSQSEVFTLLRNPAIFDRLKPLLPENVLSPEDAIEVLKSTDVKLTLELLEQALHHGVAGPLLSQFGIASPLEPVTSVDAFLRCISQAVSKQGPIPHPHSSSSPP